jgi:hypothetical protein
MKILLLAAAGALALAAPASGQAAPPPAPPAAAQTEAKNDRGIPPPTVSVTHHRGLFGRQPVAYTANASETYLAPDGSGERSESVGHLGRWFYGEQPRRRRPAARSDSCSFDARPSP